MSTAAADVTVGLRIQPALKEQLGGLARAHERSLSGEVRLALRRHVEREAGGSGGWRDRVDVAREGRRKLERGIVP